MGSKRLSSRLSQVPEPDRLCEGGNDEPRLAHRSEGNEEDAIFEVVCELCSSFQRESRLTRSTGSSQRHQPRFRPANDFNQFPELSLPTQEGSWWRREVRRWPHRESLDIKGCILVQDAAMERLQLD